MKIKLEGIRRTLKEYTVGQGKNLTLEMTRPRVWLNDTELDVSKSLGVRNHSPDGFQWGYSGSGPAQLALAICLKLYGQPRAMRVYQNFKDRFIAPLKLGADFVVELDLTEFNHAHQKAFDQADRQAKEDAQFEADVKVYQQQEDDYYAEHPSKGAPRIAAQSEGTLPTAAQEELAPKTMNDKPLNFYEKCAEDFVKGIMVYYDDTKNYWILGLKRWQFEHSRLLNMLAGNPKSYPYLLPVLRAQEAGWVEQVEAIVALAIQRWEREMASQVGAVALALPDEFGSGSEAYLRLQRTPLALQAINDNDTVVWSIFLGETDRVVLFNRNDSPTNRRTLLDLLEDSEPRDIIHRAYYTFSGKNKMYAKNAHFAILIFGEIKQRYLETKLSLN